MLVHKNFMRKNQPREIHLLVTSKEEEKRKRHDEFISAYRLWNGKVAFPKLISGSKRKKEKKTKREGRRLFIEFSRSAQSAVYGNLVGVQFGSRSCG